MHPRVRRCPLSLYAALFVLAAVPIARAAQPSAPPAAPAAPDSIPTALEPLPPPTASSATAPVATVPVPPTGRVPVPPLPSASQTTSRRPPPPPPLSADEPPATIFDTTRDYTFGGFGGVSVMGTQIAGVNGVQVCGEGAVIIDHSLTFGGGGCGFATHVSAARFGVGDPPYADDKLTFGYGGAIIRYHFFSRKVANFSIGTLIGGGGVVIGNQVDENGKPSDDANNFKEKSTEAVFVVEPQLGAFLNFTRWMRGGAMVGYRYVTGVETKGMTAADLRSPTFGATLQFGWF